MKKLKLSLLFVLTLAATPVTVHAGPFPWPWPWAFCPMEKHWDDLIERHNLVSDSTQGDAIVFQVSKTSGKNPTVGVHVRRVGADGTVWDGYKTVAAQRLLFRVKMAPNKASASPYWIKIGMALDLEKGARKEKPGEARCLQPMKPQIKIYTDEDGSAEAWYVLDPALRF